MAQTVAFGHREEVERNISELNLKKKVNLLKKELVKVEKWNLPKKEWAKVDKKEYDWLREKKIKPTKKEW